MIAEKIKVFGPDAQDPEHVMLNFAAEGWAIQHVLMSPDDALALAYALMSAAKGQGTVIEVKEGARTMLA